MKETTKKNSKKIFIVTGEYSGDVHASYVVKELKKHHKELEIEGIGGKNLEHEGVKLFADHRNMGVIGLSLSAVVNHISLGKKILRHLKREFKPDLVLLIDYGGFNLKLAKHLVKNGIEVLYYISPQVWASRKGRLSKIKKYVSKMMVTLPFEEEIHKEAGINVEYVGHPLISQMPTEFSKDEFVETNNLDPNKRIVGIFPGSREAELKYILPAFMESAKLIHKYSKKVQFCIGQSDNISDEMLQKYLNKHDLEELDVKIVKHQAHALLSVSDVVMLASGTIALEAALYETPMVIAYKAPMWFYFAYKMVRYINRLSLPNIIMDKDIVKEFLQYDARPELISTEVLSLLHDDTKYQEMIYALSQIRENLGDKIASKEVAKIIDEHLSKDNKSS